MNKIRRIAVLRSLLLDFFFDLRLAIVFPPAIQAKKSGLDPLCLVRPAMYLIPLNLAAPPLREWVLKLVGAKGYGAAGAWA